MPTSPSPGSPPDRPVKARTRVQLAADRFEQQHPDLQLRRTSPGTSTVSSPSLSSSASSPPPISPPRQAPSTPSRIPLATSKPTSPTTSLSHKLASMSLSSPPPPAYFPSEGLPTILGVVGGGAKRTRKLGTLSSPPPAPLGVSSFTNGNGVSPSSSPSSSDATMRKPSTGSMGAPKAVKRSSSVDELALLAISAGVTELGMSIQEANTLIFEIQELRHTTTTSSLPQPVATPSLILPTPCGADTEDRELPPANSLVDQYVPSEDSFAGLSARQALGGEVGTGEASGEKTHQNPSLVDAALMRLDAKLEVVAKEFAEMEAQLVSLFEGRGDDGELGLLKRKWKETVEEWEGTQRDAEILGEELKEDKWLTVFRTVSQQAEDMMKSLEKVLKQSHEFIWDFNRRTATPSTALSSSTPSLTPFSSSTQIQPLLQSFIALHRSLHAKTKYYSPACSRVLKILGKGIDDRATKNGEVLRRFGEMKVRWRNLVERIGRIESEMRGVEEVLREAAGTGEEEKGKAADKDSPLRKLARGVVRAATPSNGGSSMMGLPRSGGSAGGTRSTLSGNVSLGGGPTPQRPPRSDRRPDLPSSSAATVRARPQTLATSTSGTATHRLSKSTHPPIPSTPAHRYSYSLTSATLSPPKPTRPPRAVSPAMSSSNAADSKPRWNISTRRVDERETLREAASGAEYRRRPSLAQSMASSGGGGKTRAQSALGFRSASPAFSESSSSAWARDRPNTPSRIPMPRASIGGQGDRRSTTPFSSLEDPEPTSLLQRTMTRTPSMSPSTNRSPGRAASRPRLATPGGLSPPRPTSPTFSSYSIGGRRGAQTPEPSLVANAQRLHNVRKPVVPPVPSLPTSLQPRRSSHSPSVSSSRAGAFSPTPSHASTSAAHLSLGPYVPNPLDPLDKTLFSILSSLPIALEIERVDRPLTRETLSSGGGQSARYTIGLGSERRTVMCKIVDRVGPRATKGEKKVLVRQGTGWMDLEQFGMAILAAGLVAEA